MYKHPKKAVLTKGIFFTFLIGFYDGFFGPGAGTFFIVMLIKIFSVDFLEASGNTKLLNFSKNRFMVIHRVFKITINFKKFPHIVTKIIDLIRT